MPPTLLSASIDGAFFVAIVWILSRAVRTLSPAARTMLWWAAAAKFLIALVWVTPVVVPILPVEGSTPLTATIASPAVALREITSLATPGPQPGADPRTPVLIQSFTASSLQIFTQTLGTRLPVHFLVGARDAAPWITPEGLAKVKTFATGLSPEKTIVKEHPEAMAQARKLGLFVTPYTFRSTAVTGFADVQAEMRHYLQELGVDGVITDNPDRMPADSAR